jgi:hypothetical protein
MGCGASTSNAYAAPPPEAATEQRAPEPSAAKAPPEPEPEPEPQPPAPAPAPATDVGATKAKTRGALLGGLKSGALEAAVAKMEEDTTLEEETATDAGPVRRHARTHHAHTHTHTQAAAHTRVQSAGQSWLTSSAVR